MLRTKAANRNFWPFLFALFVLASSFSAHGQSLPVPKSSDVALIAFTLEARDSTGTLIAQDAGTNLLFYKEASFGWDPYDASKLTPLSDSYAVSAFVTERNGDPHYLKAQESVPYRLTDEGYTGTLDIVTEGIADATFTLKIGTWYQVPVDWTVRLIDTKRTTDPADDTFVVLTPSSTYTFSGRTSNDDLTGPGGPKSGEDAVSRFQVTAGPASSSLPVEMAAFTVQSSGPSAVLAWETASETNNAGFYVEHRAPYADAFTARDFVEGAGTTNAPQTYRFRLRDLSPGTHAFRLRQVDTDGTTHYSDVVTTRISLNGSFTLQSPYPNPFQSQATVAFAVEQSQPVTVALYNTLGQRVQVLYQGTPAAGQTQRARLSNKGLSSGLYIVRLETPSFQSTRTVTLVR
ncbi:T9SS type A sorting domain-containing protein [Salisaeta longa]|uniref:T9SS type A sorting domain-containing protein n=1 Tax=Salisaeta longa TaxID=503170 RepID=UPI0003B3AB1D|nr:T9SS type A sorting domain-containing protein [Salisaeta longa]